MPDYSMGGGGYNSGYGSASKLNSNNSKSKTVSSRSLGAGASLGSFSNGAAVRSRLGLGGSGYGVGRPATLSVNAAAAKAAMLADQRLAGLVQSAPGKGNSYGANQVVSKGINLSPGDMLAGGYKQYQQAISAQSTPKTAPNGWSDLVGIQRALARSAPTLTSIVAGDPVQRYGMGGYTGEISDYVTKDIMRRDPIGNTLNNALNRAEIKKEITDRVPVSVGPAPVSVSDVPHLPFQDVQKGINLSPADMLAGGYGSYQQAPAFGDSMPAGNMTPSPQSPMAGQDATFRSTLSAGQYNAAMGGLLSKRNQLAGNPNPSSFAPSDTANGLYDGDSTPAQKVAGWAETKFEKIANPAKKAGEWLNGLLGGSGYNDLYGRSGMTNPNARDPLNTEAAKDGLIAETGQNQVTSEQINSLSAPQRAEFERLVASGMSPTEAYYRVLGYTSPATQQPKTLAYPEYYSAWANLPKGTYA